MFFDGRTYQGAKGPMYPYVLVDRLSDTAVDKTYRVVWLENEYVKVGILPDLGGRIWTGQDKTNGYDFFYHQSVIKPALIGMVGAWISGGVEWNIPHHHRASTFMPVQYRVEKKDDGSATVWVGELELRHRMRWAVGVTLHPGRSNVDASVRLINRTPLAQSFLYFSNVAVHANKDYQVIFPPSTQFGTQHAKSEFTTWPIGSGRYGGNDFTGVDVSWWKNHPTPISIFAWNDTDDFLAGYDHGKEAGLVHVADHHTVPGKKFFEWGPGSEGAYWDSILTDKDGPYLELMVGGYSDNQPDYSWIQPGETKVLEQTWYPLRNMGSVKQATREAAVNLERTADNSVRVAVNTSAAYKDLGVVLEAGGKTLFHRTVSIGPAAPFGEVVSIPAGVRDEDLTLLVVGEAAHILAAYQPAAKTSSHVQRPLCRRQHQRTSRAAKICISPACAWSSFTARPPSQSPITKKHCAVIQEMLERTPRSESGCCGADSTRMPRNTSRRQSHASRRTTPRPGTPKRSTTSVSPASALATTKAPRRCSGARPGIGRGAARRIRGWPKLRLVAYRNGPTGTRCCNERKRR